MTVSLNVIGYKIEFLRGLFCTVGLRMTMTSAPGIEEPLFDAVLLNVGNSKDSAVILRQK